MDRYTRKDAERAFDRLATALDKPHRADGGGSWRRVDGQNVAQVGWWELDYNSAYGGFVIHEIDNEAGGVSCPMGHTRHTARSFCSRVNFALDALRVVETICAGCSHPIVWRHGCWKDRDGYACSAITTGDDRHVPR